MNDPLAQLNDLNIKVIQLPELALGKLRTGLALTHLTTHTQD
jgi:hypothetical protein